MGIGTSRLAIAACSEGTNAARSTTASASSMRASCTPARRAASTRSRDPLTPVQDDSARESPASRIVGRLRPRLVADQRPFLAIGTKRVVAVDLRVAGAIEGWKALTVDLFPYGLAAPEAADDAEAELVRLVFAEANPV